MRDASGSSGLRAVPEALGTIPKYTGNRAGRAGGSHIQCLKPVRKARPQVISTNVKSVTKPIVLIIKSPVRRQSVERMLTKEPRVILSGMWASA